jgi:glycosyltransferase 2 family protein
MLKRLQRLAQPALLILALLFIAAWLHSQWPELRSHPWQLHGGWLVASGVLLVAAFILEASIWWCALRILGGELAFRSGMRIWFISAVARYVPGNIWQPLSMVVFCRQRGVQLETTVTSIALYQAINLLAVVPIATVYLGSTGNFGLLAPWLGPLPAQLAFAGLLPILVFLARPGWLLALLNYVLERFGRRALPIRLSSRQLLGLMSVAVFDWALWGSGFACVTFALRTYTFAEQLAFWPHLLASYPIAYAIGYLSFLMPSGLAIREGVLYMVLAPVLGEGVTTVAALIMRIWQVLLEVGVATAIVVVLSRRQPAAEPHGLTDPSPFEMPEAGDPDVANQEQKWGIG